MVDWVFCKNCGHVMDSHKKKDEKNELGTCDGCIECSNPNICEFCFYAHPLWFEGDQEEHWKNFKEMEEKAFVLGNKHEDGSQEILQDHENEYRGCHFTKTIYPKNHVCHLKGKKKFKHYEYLEMGNR